MENSEKRKLIQDHFDVSRQRVYQVIKEWSIDLDDITTRAQLDDLIDWLDAAAALKQGGLEHCKVPWHHANALGLSMYALKKAAKRIDHVVLPSGRYALYTDDVKTVLADVLNRTHEPYADQVVKMLASGKSTTQIAKAIDQTTFNVRAAAFNEQDKGRGRATAYVAPCVQRDVLNAYLARGRFKDAVRASGLSMYMVKRVIRAHGKMLRKHKKGAKQ